MVSPRSTIADLVFVLTFGKVLKEVRCVLAGTEHGWSLGNDENQFVEARVQRHTAHETEEAYAVECVCFLGHEDLEKLLAAVRFTTEVFCKAAERHGLSVNFGVEKTEALVVLSGTGKNMAKKELKGRTPQSMLLLMSSESWNSTSIWAQCARQVVQWA